MPNSRNHTAFELFTQLKEGSPKALDAIMQEYKAPLFHYIRRFIQNEELVKEVFLDTMQAVWTQRKTMIEKDDPVAWMLRIAHNKAINKTRDEKRAITIPLEAIPYPVNDSGNGELMLEAKELEGILREAAAKLSPQERIVFTLSKIEGLDKKEIAAKCHVSENTVRNQLNSSIKKMRDFCLTALKKYLIQ